MALDSKVFFLGNCQMNRFSHFYNTFTHPAKKMDRAYLSITPHYGKYFEDLSIKNLEKADIAVVQLVLSDYVFSRENVLAIRGDKPTIFVPYVYLKGFRRIERYASKGVNKFDGADIVLDEVKREGPGKAALNYMKGQVPGQNLERFMRSLDELRSRENQGADVKVADYITDTFRDQMPCQSINHPSPHVLFEMYNQIADIAGFAQIDVPNLPPYEIGRSTLPQGHCALSPYCVDELGLNYGPETHWFATTNRLVRDVIQTDMDAAKE